MIPQTTWNGVMMHGWQIDPKELLGWKHVQWLRLARPWWRTSNLARCNEISNSPPPNSPSQRWISHMVARVCWWRWESCFVWCANKWHVTKLQHAVCPSLGLSWLADILDYFMGGINISWVQTSLAFLKIIELVFVWIHQQQ